MSYLNARYYRPDRGQFLSQDPVFNEIGLTQDGRMVLTHPQLANSYSYAGNNPVTQKDPSGRFVQYLAPLLLPNVAYSPDIGEENYTNTALESGIVVAGFASPVNKVTNLTNASKNIVGQNFDMLGKVVKILQLKFLDLPHTD